MQIWLLWGVHAEPDTYVGTVMMKIINNDPWAIYVRMLSSISCLLIPLLDICVCIYTRI